MTITETFHRRCGCLISVLRLLDQIIDLPDRHDTFEERVRDNSTSHAFKHDTLFYTHYKLFCKILCECYGEIMIIILLTIMMIIMMMMTVVLL
jgi:hypothetical protein